MTKAEQVRVTAWRLRILRQAAEEGNVARVCRRFGLSRKSFYKWKRRHVEHGDAGLCDRPRSPQQSPRATAHEVVSKILYRGLEELTYPFHDATYTVTQCGRICFKGRKVNLSHVFAGQNVGVTQVGEPIWLVTFMRYDLGYFDDETYRLEPIENPFGPKVLPIRPAVRVKVVVALFRMPH
jgi:hypothetical protein